MTVDALRRVPAPFPLAVADRLLDDEALAELATWFHVERWIRHTDVFYRCDIAVVEADAAHRLARRLRAPVARVLALDLLDQVQVTAQRMGPGDGSDVHTDRPAAGFEAARLVVQLDEAPDGGGRFRAFDEAGRCLIERPPHPGAAVAFELSRTSWHDVTSCVAPRRAVVFHYWQRGNPPGAGERLARRFAGMSFADLPRALDPLLVQAEARCDEELSWRAAAAAWWAHTEGHPVEAVRRVVEATLEGAPDPRVDRLAVRALWWVDGWREGFDRPRLWDSIDFLDQKDIGWTV